jgi:hypothetical protein
MVVSVIRITIAAMSVVSVARGCDSVGRNYGWKLRSGFRGGSE